MGWSIEMFLHSIAFPFDDDGLSMVEETIKNGGGKRAVVIEDFRPVFVSPVGREDNRKRQPKIDHPAPSDLPEKRFTMFFFSITQ